MDLLGLFNAKQQLVLSGLGVSKPILPTAAATTAPRAMGTGMGAQAAAAAAAQQAARAASARAKAQQTQTQQQPPPRALQPEVSQPMAKMPQPMQAPPRQMQPNPYAQQQQQQAAAAAQMASSPQLSTASGDHYAASILGLAPPAAAAASSSSAAAAPSGYSAANELFGSKHSAQASSQPAMLGSAFPSPAPVIGGPSLSIGGPAPRNGAAAASSSATSAAVAAAASSVSFARPVTATFDALQCPECPPGAEVIVDSHQGVEVCTNCGLVIGQVISDESEWRTFSDRRGADPNRVGGPEIGLLADAGLATLMGDSPNGLGSTLAKLQNKSAMSHNHRLLLDSFRKSSAFSTRLTLPRSLTDRADELYKKVVDSKLVVHRGSDALIAACLFAVCQAENVPRTLKEVIGATDVRKKDLGRCYKDMKRLGFLKSLRAAAVEGGAAKADGSMRESDSDMHSYIARWGSLLGMDKSLVKLAQDIVGNTSKVVLPSVEPSTKCGAALWIASQCGNANEHKTFEDVSRWCGMASETLRKLVRLFLEPDRKRVMIPEKYWDVSMSA